jgi:hypothetical protein
MFDDWDLEDFGELLESRLNHKFTQEDIKITKVEINKAGSTEWLNIDVKVDNETYEADFKLDKRYLQKPRDLAAKYADKVLYNIEAQLQEDGIFAASYSMDQEFTSKQTASGNGSFNKGQGRVPALFKKISWRPNTVNFDYGCGYKSTQDRISEFLADKGVEYIGFDKFNQTSQEQEDAWAAIDEVGGADTATCANVLNVVKERDVRVNEIIANIYDILKTGGVAYFDVYEGDRSSSGGQTGKDNYQLKRPIDRYVEEVAEIFGENNVKLRGKVIEARK